MTCLISGEAKIEIEKALNNYDFGIKIPNITFEESLFDISGDIISYGEQIAEQLHNVNIIKISEKKFIYKTNDDKYIQLDISMDYTYTYKFEIKIYKIQ